MGGTRFNNRGIDNKGFVANFVESEQMIISNTNIFSFTQIRGSLPFYWDQINVNKIKIHQTEEINKEKFLKHLKFIKENQGYKKVVLLNLLS